MDTLLKRCVCIKQKNTTYKPILFVKTEKSEIDHVHTYPGQAVWGGQS